MLLPGRPFHPDLRRFVLLLALSLFISWVSASRRRAGALLRQWGETLETRVRERTQALEDSERRYRLLFENNPQPMWVYDQNTLAFLTVNETAIRNYGYLSDGELLRTSPSGRRAHVGTV